MSVATTTTAKDDEDEEKNFPPQSSIGCTTSTQPPTPTRAQAKLPPPSSHQIRGQPRQYSSTEFAENRALQIKLILFPFCLLLVYLIFAALILRPHLTLGTLVWLFFVLFFLSSESSSTLHASQKTENKFWIGMSSIYSALLLFAPDSPFRMKQDLQGFISATLSLVVMTYLVHLWHKLSHRRSLENRRLRFPAAVSILLSPHTTATTAAAAAAAAYATSLAPHDAKSKVALVNTCLATLESAFVPGGVRRIFDRSLLMQTSEERVLDVFTQCTRDELNYLLREVNMNVCLYRLKNHHQLPAPAPPTASVAAATGEEEGVLLNAMMFDSVLERDVFYKNNRNALLELLARKRLGELTVESRAALIDAIQVVGMMRNPLTRERALQWITNIMLSTHGEQLVALKQIMDSKGSIHSLHRLVYNDVSDALIRGKLLAHFQTESAQLLGTAVSPIARERKVLSDVDDTFISSGGKYPAGMDATYPHHAVYPGASTFYSALAGGGGNLAFLSARPHVYKDVAESRVYSKFERMIKSNKLHTMPTLLPGDLDSGQAYMLRGDFEPMAQKKLRNLVEYHSLYPESRLVFIGDNGQADARAAELMVDRLGEGVIECVFIHQVQALDQSFGYNALKWSRFCFYKTMVGAALQASKRDMISPAQLQECMSAAKEDFGQLITHKFPGGVLGVELRRQELVQDFCAANAWLQSQSGMEAAGVSPPPALCMYAVGSTVYTKLFGMGIVKDFRASDGMYKLGLLSGQALGWFTLVDLFPAPVLPSTRGGAGLFAGLPLAIPVDSLVKTRFGEGTVRRYRAQDGVFEVEMTKWPAIAFLQQSELQVVKLSTKQRLLGMGKAFFQRSFAPRKPSDVVKEPPSPSVLQQQQQQQRAEIVVGSTVQVGALGRGVVLAWREEDLIAHLRFPAFESYTHLSSITTTLSKQEEPILPRLLRKRNLSLESIKNKVVSKLFSPKHHQQQLQHQPPQFRLGDTVRVGPFGLGIVKQIRLADGIAEVNLLSGMTSYAAFSACVLVPRAPTASLYEMAVSALQSWVSFEEEEIRVRTPFGEGVLQSTRTDGDGICKVRLDWGATAYLNPASVERLAERRNRLFSLLSPQTSPKLKPSKSADGPPLPRLQQQQQQQQQLPVIVAPAAPPAVKWSEGGLLRTPFGDALITQVLPKEGMVKVKFSQWPAIATLRMECCSVV